MKKIKYILFSLIIFMNLTIINYAANNSCFLAEAKIQRFVVNNRKDDVQTYMISSTNYISLRDFSVLLKDTDKKFRVDFDKDNNKILIKKDISSDDTIEIKKLKRSVACISKQKIFIDDKEILIDGVNIRSKNYYKLRDIANALNVSVVYDKNTKVINIK